MMHTLRLAESQTMQWIAPTQHFHRCQARKNDLYSLFANSE